MEKVTRCLYNKDMYWAVSIFLGFSMFAQASDKKFSDDEKIHIERIESFIEQGLEDEAFVSLSDFNRRFPNSLYVSKVDLLRGHLHYRRREWREAENNFRKLMLDMNRLSKTEPDLLGEAIYFLGLALVKQKKTFEAQVEWGALVRRFPNASWSEKSKHELSALLSSKGTRGDK